jgi:hypothetical protein
MSIMRKLIWHEESGLLGCSVCGWVFRTKSPLAGRTVEETARNFESQCDAAFASHICADHLDRGTDSLERTCSTVQIVA